MEGVELEVREERSARVGARALERKTGARGLRSILEQSLLDTMFDLPSLENVSKVVVDESIVIADGKPLLIYSDQPESRRWRAGCRFRPSRGGRTFRNVPRG